MACDKEQVFMEILLVCGPPPPSRVLRRYQRTSMQQEWSLGAHVFLLNRGIGDDAIDRARITDEFYVWLALQDIKEEGK